MRMRARSEGSVKRKIGSRVFPFRTSPPAAPASMPTAGMRRSTRVFVKTAGDAEPARILRSGRQVSAPTPRGEWMKSITSADGEESWWKGRWTDPEPKKGKKAEEKMFRAVYSRKRHRSVSSEGSDDQNRKFGIFFSRKHRRKGPKPSTLPKEFLLELAVVAESTSGHNSDIFAQVLASIMRSMMSVRVRLRDLALFLSSGAIAGVFSANGIHFLTVEDGNNDIINKNSFPGYGLCKIYGVHEFTPLVSLNYSAVPSFFWSLHAARIPASLRISGRHLTEQMMSLEGKFSALVLSEESEIIVSETRAIESNEVTRVTENQGLLPHSSVDMNSCRPMLPKHKKKRRSLRLSTARNPSCFGSFDSYQDSVCASSATKLDFRVDPVYVKPFDTYFPDLYNGNVVTSPGSNSKQGSLARKKSSNANVKEMRSTLAKVRQNIHSARCKANILIAETDKCWREDGAEVMLEMSDSLEWLIAVKRMGRIRYLHKPQDLKPCVVNRVNNACIWSGYDGWKLEFCDRWDWHVFKELHLECRERNTQYMPGKIIPVPGVIEVSGYEDDNARAFLRPSIYIHMADDEVGRALASKVALYDMDSADEDWLRQLNSSYSSTEEGGEAGFSCISEEYFEKIIFAFERDSYNCVDGRFSKEKALDLCQGPGKREMISVVYDYWLKKKKQRRSALVGVFQGPPLRAQFLKKKRSFKRQRGQDECIQARKGKAHILLQVQQDAQKVQEAESAANRVAEVAIKLRSRAHVLMANADLAVYRAIMALRIAEIIHASSEEEPPNFECSILSD